MANPFLDSMGIPLPKNPYDPAKPSAGLSPLSGSLAAANKTVADLGAASSKAIRGRAPKRNNGAVTPFKAKPKNRHIPTGPNVLFSPSQGQVFVNGTIFDLDDADAAIRTQDNLSQPRQPAPKGLDWQEVSPEEYATFIQGIKDPGAGRVFAENFATGTANLQSFAGNLAVLGGAEKFGTKLRESAAEKQRKNAPFSYEFTDVLDGEATAADWFVGALASTAPLLIESLITTIAGAVLGSAVATPGIGTAAGALAGLVGKKAFKKAVKEAADEYVKQKLVSKAAAKAFLKTPKGQVLVKASGIAGMALANYGNNYAIGTADIYGELLDNGIDPKDMDAKMTALSYAVPYAAFETIPEFILGAKILGGLTKGSKGGILKRAGKGALVGGPTEGIAELGQNEVVTRAGEKHGKDYGDERLTRAINAFAAGFAVGAPIGGIANLKNYDPSDILTGSKQPPEDGDTGAGAINKLPPEFSAGTPPTPGPAGLPTAPPGGTSAEGGEAVIGTQGTASLDGELLDPLRDINKRSTPPGFGPDIIEGQETTFVSPPERVALNAPPVATTPTTAALPAPPQQPAPTSEAILPGLASVPPATKKGKKGKKGAKLKKGKKKAAPKLSPEAAVDVTELNKMIKDVKDRDAIQNAKIQANPNISEAEKAEDIADRIGSSGEYIEELQDLIREYGVEPEDTSSYGGEQIAAAPEALVQPSRSDTEASTPPVSAPAVLPHQTKGEKLKKGKKQPAPVETAPVAEATPAPILSPEDTEELASHEQAIKDATAQLKRGAETTFSDLTPAEGRRQLENDRREVNSYIEDMRGEIRSLKPDATFAPDITFEEILPEKYKEGPAPTKAAKLKKGKKQPAPVETAPVAEAMPVAQKAPDALAAVAEALAKRSAITKGETLKRGKNKPVADAIAAAVTNKPSKEELATVADIVTSPPVESTDKAKNTMLVDSVITGFGKSKGDPEMQVASLLALVDIGYYVGENRDLFTLEASTRAQEVIAQITKAIAVATKEKNPSEYIENLGESFNVAMGIAYNSRVDLKAAAQASMKERIAAGYPELSQVLFSESSTKTAAADAIGIAPNAPVQTQSTLPLEEPTKAETLKKGKAKPAQVQSSLLPEEPSKGAQLKKGKKQPKATPSANPAQLVVETQIEKFETASLSVDSLSTMHRALSILLDYAFFTDKKNKSADEFIAAKKAKEFIETADGATELALDLFTTKAKALKSWGKSHPGYKFAEEFGLNEDIRASKTKKKVENSPDPIAKFEPTNDKELLDKDLMFDEIEDGEFEAIEELVFKRVDNNAPIKGPLPRIKLMSLVKSFAAKLLKKPNFHIYKDKAELKRRNPNLYNRIEAALPSGDFNNVEAVALSIGEEVVIFSDNIYTEQQAKFVLAHEALGHFGFRSILTNAELNRHLDTAYHNDAYVRAAADRNIHYGMGRHEAIEEVIADKAAQLDANVISRLWTGMKNALNRMGLKFSDDMARYLVSQARRNVYNGGASVVSPGKLMNDLKSVQDRGDTVRFDRAQDTADAATVAMHSDANNRRSIGLRGLKDLIVNRLKDVKSAKDIGSLFGSMLENVQSLDNMSTRSDGLSRVFNIFQMRANRARRFLANYENMTAFSHAAFKFKNEDGTSEGGPSKQELLQAGKLLIYGSLFKQHSVSDTDIKAMDDLVTASGDVVGVNRANLQGARDAGTVTREEFAAGIEVTLGDPDTDVSRTEQWKPDFEITDRVWKIYTEQRDAVEQSALDVLTSIVEGGIAQKEDALGGFKIFGTRGNKITDLDLQTIKLMMKQYSELYQEGSYVEGGRYMYKAESVSKATLFLREVNRAMFNSKKLDDWKLGREGTANFQGGVYAEILKGIETLHAKNLTQNNANKITSTIGNLYLLDVQVTVAQFEAKRTIMRSYAPATRRGTYQILVRAFDAKGDAVSLGQEWGSVLPYYQANSAADAREIMEDINKDFGDKTYDIRDANGETQTITFRATSGKNRQGSALGQQFSLSDFVNVLSRLDININPTERERIVTALTRQTDKARRSLQRAGVRGWDEDIVRSVSEYLETQGHIAGQAFYRHKLDNVMLDDNLWRGDHSKLKKLEAEYKRTDTTTEERREAELTYDKYAYMYQHMADVGQPEATNRRNGKPLANEGKGEDYRANALRLQQWYSEAANINDSTEDLLSGETGSKIKLWVVIAQLGGSVATAGVNLLSIATNAIPYLANYNADRGFGGGFGLANTTFEIQRAARGQADHKLSSAAYLDRVVNSAALQAKHSLSQDEAIFMRDATYEGILQSAQANALIGTARGGIHSNKLQGGIKAWMLMFSYTEQYNRRVTALASYRLYKKRAIAGTPNFEKLSQKEQDTLVAQWEATGSEFARTAVNTSQGEYGMFNRPELARGNIGQYLFIYKQFTIITIQLMKGLDVKGRLQMLSMIFLLAGLKGMPFSEDLMDLFDTLLQMFGVKQASVEAAIIEMVEDVAPGWSPVLLRGLLDQYSPATVSTRAGFGDIIPLTGVGRAGSDPYRELSNFLGPAWAGIEGAFVMAGNAASYGAQTLGIKDKTMSFVDVFRDTPVAALRGFSDAFTYHTSGAVTNADGKVIDPSASYGQIAARALGFYPSIATKSNDVIRLSKFKGDYIKALRATYTKAYVQAYVAKDRVRMLEVEDMVRDWNLGTRNTAYEFKDFRRRALRAAKAAAQPSTARYLATASKNLHPDIVRLMEIYDVDNLDELD